MTTPSSTLPRPLPSSLIATLAVRNAANPCPCNKTGTPNCDSTRLSFPGGPRVATPLLISVPAIRIRPKPHRINHLKFSNRHKTAMRRSIAVLSPSLRIPNRNNSESEIAATCTKQSPLFFLIARRTAPSRSVERSPFQPRVQESRAASHESPPLIGPPAIGNNILDSAQ